MKKVAGHELLARVGKKKLRPGGKEATDWLIEHAKLNKDKKVLEVACNMGTTLIEIVKTYDLDIIGVDMSKDALEKAQQNIKNENLESKVKLVNADARDLPFEDESFDVVINEAMLTMLNHDDKQKAINEYFRVLKKGGILLTHDVNLPHEDPEFIKKLRNVIAVPASPLNENNWKKLFEKAGFSEITTKAGKMIFMSEKGLMKDEGYDGMMKMYENAAKDPNYQQFIEMKKFFVENEDEMNYIAVVSQK